MLVTIYDIITWQHRCTIKSPCRSNNNLLKTQLFLSTTDWLRWCISKANKFFTLTKIKNIMPMMINNNLLNQLNSGCCSYPWTYSGDVWINARIFRQSARLSPRHDSTQVASTAINKRTTGIALARVLARSCSANHSRRYLATVRHVARICRDDFDVRCFQDLRCWTTWL